MNVNTVSFTSFGTNVYVTAGVIVIEDICGTLWRHDDEWLSYEMLIEDDDIVFRVMARAYHRQMKHRMKLRDVIL